METKKTAVQQLMTELQELHPSLFDVHTEKGRQFVNHFHKFLAMEKQQIIDALFTGYNSDKSDLDYLETGYYNETYGGEQ